MLIGIPSVVSPELLYVLDTMGHGDDIAIVDAFYPGVSQSKRCLRADGVESTILLDGILSLMNPDSFVSEPVLMMSPVPGDNADPSVEAGFRTVIDKHWPDTPAIAKLDRFGFYKRAMAAFAVVITGSTKKYGCIIIKKGVIPV